MHWVGFLFTGSCNLKCVCECVFSFFHTTVFCVCENSSLMVHYEITVIHSHRHLKQSNDVQYTSVNSLLSNKIKFTAVTHIWPLQKKMINKK